MIARGAVFFTALLACAPLVAPAETSGPNPPQFHTSDRCVACHNGLLTASGEDVSIGFDWRASMMANSSRDPYWQASAAYAQAPEPKRFTGYYGAIAAASTTTLARTTVPARP